MHLAAPLISAGAHGKPTHIRGTSPGQQFTLTHTRGIPLVAAPQPSCASVLGAARRAGFTIHLLFLLAVTDCSR
jgi:hypothetical protein